MLNALKLENLPEGSETVNITGSYRVRRDNGDLLKSLIERDYNLAKTYDTNNGLGVAVDKNGDKYLITNVTPEVIASLEAAGFTRSDQPVPFSGFDKPQEGTNELGALARMSRFSKLRVQSSAQFTR